MPASDPHDPRAARAAPSAAETRLRAVLDAAVDAIVTIDERGVIESANPATERMFGYPPDELVGANVSMLMPSPYARDHDHYLRNYLDTGERRIIGVGREVEGLRSDGCRFPIDLTVTEFEIAGRRMFTGLIRDISDRRAAELAAQRRLDELAHAGRLADLGLVTSTIAHEVNQPLAAIVSFAHACQRMLAAGELDEALLGDALGQIAAQGERASEIIARIRAMAGKRETAPEPVDVNHVVRSVLSLMANPLRFAHVRIELDLAEDLPQVRADRVQVEQVIMNLVANALDAMREVDDDARRLRIRTGRADAAVQVTVRDSGPGLGDAQVERIFDSFYTTKPGGMGVGLSICRSLAEAHGGRLWADASEAAGATFHLNLPARP